MISNSGNDSLNHDRMEQYNTLPCLNITSPNTFHHLTNSDVDLNMPVDQNFSYYSIENFKSNYDINECSSNKTSFSALNCNIRSLPANYDNFMHMLSELNFPFSLLGFSETKFKVDQERLVNVNIPGYNLISEPSLSNAGGVAFYVKNNLKFSVRSDITTVDQNFEALWIEIDTIGQPNLVCGILYRHPNGNLDKFMEYMNLTIEKIHQENKLCLFMGDFNIDLLKIDTHITSEKFINVWFQKISIPPHGGFFQFDPPTPQDFPFQRVSPYSPHPPEIPCFVFWSPLPLGKFISTKQKQESGHLCLFYHVRL